MSRNTRSLRIGRFNHFENYMYNLNGKHLLHMQPPSELDTASQQKWLKKQARYRRPTNNGIRKGYDTTCSSAHEGPSTLNTVQTGFQTLQGGENLPQQLSLNPSKYTDNVIQDTPPSLIHDTSGCKINAANTAAFDNDTKSKRLMHNDFYCCTHDDNHTFQPTSINQDCSYIEESSNVSENSHKCDIPFTLPVYADMQNAAQGYASRQNNQSYNTNTMKKQTRKQKKRTAVTYTYGKTHLKCQNPPNSRTDPGSKRQDTTEYFSMSSTDACTKGVSSLYIGLGNPDYECQYCNAMFWYNERLKGNSHQRYPKYTKCCGGGQVYLKKEADPHEYFKYLFKNKHFLDNIRAYNQMFSMTAFGAEIDESINNGKGPYVFKISGQIHHWIGTLCPTNGEDPRFLQLYIYDTENEVHNRMDPFGGTERSGLKAEIVERLIQTLNEHNELVKLFRTVRDKINEGNVPEFKIQLFRTPPSSPHPYLDDLEDLPPRSTNPPPITFEGQQPMFFHPVFSDIHGPLYHDAPPPQPQPQQLSPRSTLHSIDEEFWINQPNTQAEINEELNRLYAFSNMVDSHLHEAMDLQSTLLAFITGPTNNPPPPTSNNPPPPSTNNQPPSPPQNHETTLPLGFSSHDCSHCERTAHLAQRTNILVNELQSEMRFILNHILERLNAISHPPQ